jgi:Flp pilus assembly protein TadD
MGPGATGSVSFALVKLQRLVQSFDELGASASPTEAGVHRVLRLAEQLGATALPLCLRELAGDANRARWAEVLLVHLGSRPELHERVVTALRELASHADRAEAARTRARRMLADLGERLSAHDDAPGDARAPGDASPTRDDTPPVEPTELRASMAGLLSQADVAQVADRLLATLEPEVLGVLIDELGESDRERAIWLADEVLLRTDLDPDLRQALRRVRAPLLLAGSAGRPGERGVAGVLVSVQIGRHESGRMVVIAAHPMGSRADGRREHVRVMGVLLGADGALSDGLYSDELAASRLDRDLFAPLRRRGYRFAKAKAAAAADLVREAARATMCLGRPLPRAFYLGRDLLGLYDEHMAGLRADDDDGPLLDRGLQLLDEGTPARARPLLERYVRRVPDNAEGRAALARCLLRLDALEPARVQLVQAIALDPDNPLPHWNLAAIAHRQGRSGGCYLALLDYLDLVGEGVFDAGAGACDVRLDTARGFVAEYERLARIEYPEARPAAVARAEDLVHKAQQRVAAGETEAAVALLEQALAMVPSHHPAWAQLGMIFDRCGCADDAERCLRQALALRPGDPVVLGALARLAQERV